MNIYIKFLIGISLMIVGVIIVAGGDVSSWPVKTRLISCSSSIVFMVGALFLGMAYNGEERKDER